MSDAADKLARTRRAILEQIARRERGGRGRDGDDVGLDEDEDETWESNEPPTRSAAGSSRKLRGRLGAMRRALMSWWRHHPAHLGLELATPALSSYAGRQPLRFVGIAAAVGALAAILRPWRLISLTGLLVALVKTSQLSNVVMSALSAADFRRDPTPYE
jgi:hypothetical protein